MRKLIKLRALQQSDFTLADGEESIYAPSDLQERHQHHGFINDGVLRGIPIIWETTGYYEPETDCSLPSQVLARYYTETDWESVWKAEQAKQEPKP